MSAHGSSVVRTPLVFGVVAALALSAGLSLSGSVAQAAPGDIPVHIFTFNDFHGRIDGTVNAGGTIGVANADGSMNYGTALPFAYTVESLALAAPNDSMVVSAGDNIGASLFASSIAADAPTIQLLNDLAAATNFKASSVGNHEFDGGLANLQGAVANQMSGWGYTSANVVSKATGQPVLPPYVIYTLGNGVTVAVVAAVTQETPALVTPGGVATVDFTEPVAAVNKVADQLKDGNPANGEADVVVAVYHDGSPVGDPATLADGMAASAAFADIVTKTDANVDAIVNGHTHARYSWTDANGRPVVEAASYGAYVGQIDLTVDPVTKKVTSAAATTVKSAVPAGVDPTSIGNMPLVQQHLVAALNQSSVLGNQTVGKIAANVTTAHKAGEWLNGTYQNTGTAVRDDRASESSLARLVADAFLWTGNNSPAIPDHNIDIGIINAGGGLRSELCMNGLGAGSNTCLDTNGDGLISYAEANAILPFANNLWTLSLTGAQFKQFLEEQWQTLDTSGTRPTRPFLATGLSSNVTFTVNTDDPAAAPCMFDSTAGCGWSDPSSHITSVWVNGQPLDEAKTYNILTVSFLPNGGGDNYRVMKQATNVKDTGLLDRDAWIDYLMNQSGIKALGGTPTKAIAPDFARQSVVVPALFPQAAPMAPVVVAAGSAVTEELTRLDLTSLGSPANTSVDTYLVPLAAASLAAPAAAQLLVSTPMRAWDDPDACGAGPDGGSRGCAKFEAGIPATTPAGDYELVSIAQPSGTTVRTAVTVVAPAPVNPAVTVEQPTTTVTGGAARLADGQDAYTALISLKDASGAFLFGLADALSAVPSDPAVTVSAVALNVDDPAAPAYTFTATSSKPGLYTITVTLLGKPVGQPVAVNFIGADMVKATVQAGDTAASDGLGFLPTEKVEVTVDSTPINWVSYTQDKTGKVSVTFPTKDLAVGNHTVIYTGSVSGTATVPFTVTAPTITVKTIESMESVKPWSDAANAAGGVVGVAFVMATNQAGQPVDGVTVTYTFEGVVKAFAWDATHPWAGDLVAATSCVTGQGAYIPIGSDVILPVDPGTCGVYWITTGPGTGKIHAFADGVELSGSPMTVTATQSDGPRVDPTKGTTVTGSAWHSWGGVEVRVLDANGKPVPGCEKMAVDAFTSDDDPYWFSCTPKPALKAGATITVVAVDQFGNVSKPTTVTVQGPSAPDGGAVLPTPASPLAALALLLAAAASWALRRRVVAPTR